MACGVGHVFKIFQLKLITKQILVLQMLNLSILKRRNYG